MESAMTTFDHSHASSQSRRSSRRPREGFGLGLLRRCGLAPRNASAEPFGGLDRLEGRILLGGDHPDFDLPLTPASGTLITLNGGNGEGSDTGTIGTNGDQDLFRFTAVADDFVRVWADTVNAASALNSRVEVYTLDGPPPIASGSTNGNLTGGTFLDGWAGFVAEAGQTYFVVVMSDVVNGGAGSTGDYILRVDGLSEGAVTIDTDPNSPTFGFGQQAGSIATVGSDRVYTVTAGSDPGFLSLATFIGAATATDFDTRLDIYDSTGTLVTANSESGNLSNAFATAISEQDKLFYVRVRSDEFTIGEPTAQGPFTLKVDLAATAVTIDPVIRRGQNTDGELATTQDSALYSFLSQGSGRAIITVVGLPIPPLADPALRIYDDTGKAVAFNKLFGAAEVQITLEGGRTYYAVVEAFDDPVPAGGLFGIWFEANHTFDSAIPVDDHVDTPAPGTFDEVRRAFEQATPLLWGQAELLLDADGNPISDHSYIVNALGSGRIQGAGDTDLFSFVPQMDMLGGYGGDDGNEDAALYVGGAGTFTLHGTVGEDYEAFEQDFLAILDAPGRSTPPDQKWWNAGLGVNGTIRAMTVFDPDNEGPERAMLIVAGEFTEAGGASANRIAAWVFDPFVGAFVWATLGQGPTNGVNGTVHSLTVYDPDGDADDFDPMVYVGGEFTNKGNHLARWSPAAGWQGVAGGVDDTVYAMTVFDPPTVGDLDNPLLIVGGAFTDKGNHIAVYDGEAGTFSNDPAITDGTDGNVYALTTYDNPGQDGDGEEIPNVVVLGGEFTDAGGTAASNIASLTFVDNGGAAEPLWDNLGTGTDGAVLALTVWDRDGEEEDFVPLVIAGGEFEDPGAFIAAWDGNGWGEIGTGMNAPVRALAVFTDIEYNPFDIDAQGNVFNEPRLWAGGDFTEADGQEAQHIAKFEIDQFTGLTFWIGRAPGSTDTVYALAGFNDEIAGAWDRADRAATRMQVILAPTTESFLNTFITVYDSNFNVIYTNDTIAPPFPDPSGMIDTASAPGVAFPGITVWGGETYYIEVSGVSGTGRYEFIVQTDACPPDLNGDGIYDDTVYQYAEIPNAGQWDAAPELILDGNGDGRAFTTPNNSSYNIRVDDPTPSGFQVVQNQEHALIETITDTDLYLFRAPVTGTVEIRINTTQIADQNYERIFNLFTGQVEINDNTNTYNSRLDSTITIFRNDLSEIVFNDDNAAIQGEYDAAYSGTYNRTFYRRDARVVFHVTAGDTYFVQVGSGQAAAYAENPEFADWRTATGSYELLVNAEPNQAFVDDHADSAAGAEAMIPIVQDILDPANGTGSITGEIDNVLGNPVDADFFGFIAPGAGVVTLTVNADENSLVIPSVEVTDVSTGQVIALGTAGGDGRLTLNFPAAKGDRFTVAVVGSGSSEGLYTVSVSGIPFVDEHSDETRWGDATELTILDFLGSATAFGSIDSAGDTDLFKFTTPGYDIATVSVQKIGGSLNTFVRVYEISEDLNGNPIHLQIAYNDDFLATDSQVSFPITAPDRTSGLTGNTYNTYYILVSGNDPEIQSGDYQVTLNLTPTDDHPDAGQFDFASTIIVDPGTGVGDSEGELEESGDTDLFQFTAPAGGPLTIDIGAIEGSTLRPRIRVFDINEQPVLDINTGLDFDDGDDTLLSAATFSFDVVRNQTYYILVEGLAGGANTTDAGQYTVALLGPTVDDHANITEFSLATPIGLNVLTGEGLSAGVIGILNDTDLFYFTTFEAGDHGVTITTPGSGLAPRIRVFDGSEAMLIDVTDGGGQDEDGLADGAVTFTVNAAAGSERYYILVSAGVGGDDTGSYSVAIDGQAPDEPPPDGSDDHPDAGEFDLADGIVLSTLTGDGSAIGTIENEGDTDLFVFSSLAAGAAFVQIITPGGTLLDAGVRIYGPDRALILSDTEGVPGANANAVFTTGGASQLYYVEVDGLGAGVGSYTVRVNTQPEVNYLYFPEGFANANIREYVSIANPNGTAATYTVTLYYEDPSLEPVVLQSNVVLDAGSRGGLTLSAGGEDGLMDGIVADTPYSLVITSDLPLGANFSHYDFGQALGDSFTERTSSTWTFARAERLSGFVDDFITFFNPNDNAVTVTLTAYTDAGLFTLQQTVEANRRGGWNLDAETSLPLGAFGLRLTSAPASGGDPHIGIVAALSHYNAVDGEGDLSLGDPDGGTNAGIIPSLTYSPDSNPQITFFNPSNAQISVTIRGTYINAALPTFNRILTVGARDSITLEGADIGLVSAQPIGLRYTSTGDVTVLARQSTTDDSDATQASTQAASSWYFGDAFINADSAGVTYLETLNFFNPDAASTLPITVSLFFNDGTSASTVVNVGADGFADLALHELSAILNRGGLNFFSIQVTAARPFVTSFTHYDLFLGGGWTATGAPLGLLNPIDSII
jgi:hypothetical protein